MRFGRKSRRKSRAVSRIMFPGKSRVTIIHLGRCSRNASSHLPAAGSGRSVGRLFDVAPRRDCPFHPTRSRLVSVALIRASRRTGVTCYGALRSPDFPPAVARRRSSARLSRKEGTLQDFSAGRGKFAIFLRSCHERRRAVVGECPVSRTQHRISLSETIMQHASVRSALAALGCAALLGSASAGTLSQSFELPHNRSRLLH